MVLGRGYNSNCRTVSGQVYDYRVLGPIGLGLIGFGVRGSRFRACRLWGLKP